MARRETFDELTALMHRRTLEHRDELKAIAGDASGAMRVLTIVLNVLEAAIAELRTKQDAQQPVGSVASSTDAKLHEAPPEPSTPLEGLRRSRTEALLAQLDTIVGPDSWRALVSGAAALHETLTEDVDHDRVSDATDAWIEGLQCLADARDLLEEVGTGEAAREAQPPNEVANAEASGNDFPDEETLRGIEQSQADAEEIWRRGIAKEGASVTLAHYRELKRQRAVEKGPQPCDTLQEPPSPKVGVRNLTRAELVRVHEIGRQCVGRYHESAFTLFIAEVLPRFKDAAGKGQSTVPMWRQDWQNAAGAAGVAASDAEPLLAAINLFVCVKEQGSYGGERFAAEWTLREGAYSFDGEAPKKSLYLRSAKPERKWRSFQAALAGEDGRSIR